MTLQRPALALAAAALLAFAAPGVLGCGGGGENGEGATRDAVTTSDVDPFGGPRTDNGPEAPKAGPRPLATGDASASDLASDGDTTATDDAPTDGGAMSDDGLATDGDGGPTADAASADGEVSRAGYIVFSARGDDLTANHTWQAPAQAVRCERSGGSLMLTATRTPTDAEGADGAPRISLATGRPLGLGVRTPAGGDEDVDATTFWLVYERPARGLTWSTTAGDGGCRLVVTTAEDGEVAFEADCQLAAEEGAASTLAVSLSAGCNF